MAKTLTARGNVVLYVDIMRISPLVLSRECCRQPNGRSLLPLQLDRASIVGHARKFVNHLPSGGLVRKAMQSKL